MSTQSNQIESMLNSYQGGMTTAAIQQSLRQADNLQTTKFAWHAWADIGNRRSGGNGGKLIYSTLRRMELIPVYAWPVSRIRVRTAGHIPGGRLTGHIVGGECDQVLQPTNISEAFIKKAYSHFGLIFLESLTTDVQQERLEAFLLYDAIMRAVRNAGDEKDFRGDYPGIEYVLEDLPTWLREVAPKNLEWALKHGVTLDARMSAMMDKPTYKLDPKWKAKGEMTIEEMLEGVAISTTYALHEESGVLVVTRGEMQAAEKGKEDSKMRMDRLDTWLSHQFPSFSFDTPVERAQRANAGIIGAVQDGQQDSKQLLSAVLEQNKTLAEQNRIMMEYLTAGRFTPPVVETDKKEKGR